MFISMMRYQNQSEFKIYICCILLCIYHLFVVFLNTIFLNEKYENWDEFRKVAGIFKDKKISYYIKII